MKTKLFALALIVAGSLAVESASAQVHVNVNFERDYPGYTYYSYPKWHGHYRDQAYYDHYHARFEREHRTYFHGRQFDHDRYDREHHGHH
jgi:hypothetical protein